MQAPLRIGIGFDAHRFSSSPDRKLRLGGMVIPGCKGLAGHSDADVLLHAIMDALLGALALSDIGVRFPDTDSKYQDADSTILTTRVMRLVTARGYEVANLDCVVVCDQPKLAHHAVSIRTRIARLLAVQPNRVGLQAKTCEGTGLAAPGRSIAAMVVVLLRQKRTVRPRDTGLRIRLTRLRPPLKPRGKVR
ncbi:MAG: 2-C-methyl-D-erythritol 2,4-cyclodiphosphate synthase [candidate division WOR-3 bacterium]